MIYGQIKFRKVGRGFVLLLAVLAGGVSLPFSQNEPYVVHDTKAVILHGPYLSSLSETDAVVVWMTDTPCHAKVVFREEGGTDVRETDTALHGLLPIGTRHVVRLEGLEPGTTYRYTAVATRVVRMKAYWPEKGLPVESPESQFTTFDRTKPAVRFAAVTDTHEDTPRIQSLLERVERTAAEFLIHLGDAFHSLESEEQLFRYWLGPAARQAHGGAPLFFVRGNHELRGAFARDLFDYLPTPEGRYYFARDHGPLHLIFLDTGEDKSDETNVYAELNNLASYREEEYEWLANHFATDIRASEAAFRIVLLHQPDWGWTGDRGEEWTALANVGRVDLAIGGHYHRTRFFEPGEHGNAFPVLVLGQDHVALVEATEAELNIALIDKEGKTVDTRTIEAKR